VLAAHFDRGLEFEHGAALVGRAVRTVPDAGIELEARALPDDAQHHVGCRHVVEGGIDGFLKRMRGGVESVLPAQHLELDAAFELAVEAVGDEFDARALRRNVGRRGREDAQRACCHG